MTILIFALSYEMSEVEEKPSFSGEFWKLLLRETPLRLLWWPELFLLPRIEIEWLLIC